MDAILYVALIVFIICASIVGYRVVEGLLPTPSAPPEPPAAPRSDFQVLTDAVSDELERLHKELSSFSNTGSAYDSIVKEIGRLNVELVKQYKDAGPQANV